MAILKAFYDGSFLEYNRGSFDDWCVYYTTSDGRRSPPRDTDYFKDIKDLASVYGTERIYADYVSIYDCTKGEAEEHVLQYISELSERYEPNDALKVDVLFSILYMAMVAEERKANTKLGRRIKRLGMYFLLYEGASVSHAANFMRGMGWREIAALCEERGF